MVKRIILCEGRTDAILISYFLIQRFGWHFSDEVTRRPPVGLPADRSNETLNWYAHPDRTGQELAIWGVGGKEAVRRRLIEVMERNKVERRLVNQFARVVVFCDRDRQSAGEIVRWLKEGMESVSVRFDTQLMHGRWQRCQIELDRIPTETVDIDLLIIALPTESEGNLETFLADSLKQNSPADEQVVEEAEGFIAALPDAPYLVRRRLRQKATLGAVLAVMSPDWVFSRLDDRLRRVEWRSIEKVAQIYSLLSAL